MLSGDGGTGEVAAARTDVAEKSPRQKKVIASDGGESSAAAEVAASSSLVRWERFLPKLAVRVLLVEADDSTRQIIAALLRKCSYKGWLSCRNLDFASFFAEMNCDSVTWVLDVQCAGDSFGLCGCFLC